MIGILEIERRSTPGTEWTLSDNPPTWSTLSKSYDELMKNMALYLNILSKDQQNPHRRVLS
jgi:hypothetical protein